jgi:hypothetical protein
MAIQTAQKLLINQADFIGLVELPNNLPPAKLNTAIQQAQQFDLAEVMGFEFYSDFMYSQQLDQTPTEAYKELLNGGNYNTKYYHTGLKAVLVFFSAARLVRSIDLHITPNGMMIKRNEYSDHADLKEIGKKATEYENTARAYWQESVNFINFSGKDNFPLWANFGCNSTEVTGRQRILGISGRSIHTYGRRR